MKGEGVCCVLTLCALSSSGGGKVRGERKGCDDVFVQVIFYGNGEGG